MGKPEKMRERVQSSKFKGSAPSQALPVTGSVPKGSKLRGVRRVGDKEDKRELITDKAVARSLNFFKENDGY
jgi:hypothetical protein